VLFSSRRPATQEINVQAGLGEGLPKIYGDGGYCSSFLNSSVTAWHADAAGRRMRLEKRAGEMEMRGSLPSL